GGGGDGGRGLRRAARRRRAPAAPPQRPAGLACLLRARSPASPDPDIPMMARGQARAIVGRQYTYDAPAPRLLSPRADGPAGRGVRRHRPAPQATFRRAARRSDRAPGPGWPSPPSPALPGWASAAMAGISTRVTPAPEEARPLPRRRLAAAPPRSRCARRRS